MKILLTITILSALFCQDSTRQQDERTKTIVDLAVIRMAEQDKKVNNLKLNMTKYEIFDYMGYPSATDSYPMFKGYVRKWYYGNKVLIFKNNLLVEIREGK